MAVFPLEYNTCKVKSRLCSRKIRTLNEQGNQGLYLIFVLCMRAGYDVEWIVFFSDLNFFKKSPKNHRLHIYPRTDRNDMIILIKLLLLRTIWNEKTQGETARGRSVCLIQSVFMLGLNANDWACQSLSFAQTGLVYIKACVILNWNLKETSYTRT